MKNLVRITIVILILICISFFIYGIIKKSSKKASIEEKISSLPEFSFVDVDGKVFSSTYIKEGPVLIVKFHPECEHCQYEISEILSSKIPLNPVKVLFITNSSKENAIQFFSQFDKSRLVDSRILIDTAFLFMEIFGKDLVPSNYIYDKDLKLRKALYGEYKVEVIEKLLGLNE
jgi:thiol-disulfide isomerase/thioredoxin